MQTFSPGAVFADPSLLAPNVTQQVLPMNTASKSASRSRAIGWEQRCGVIGERPRSCGRKRRVAGARRPA